MGVWWLGGATFVEKQKAAKKTQKEGKENTENNLFFEQWKHFFIVLKKVVFENTENTKNKNTPLTPNMFLVFFVFKNKKQFLKTATKQTLNFSYSCCKPTTP